MDKLHPGARWLFRVRAFWSIAFLIFFFFIFTIGILSSFLGGKKDGFIVGFFVIAVVIFIVLLALIEIYARLAYKNWQYEIGKESIRLERGIIWKKYSNIPYERVQNVDIHRGIIARMLGFSSLMIQTAGYSAHGGATGLAEGFLPAIDSAHAEQIREYVLKRISGKHQGL